MTLPSDVVSDAWIRHPFVTRLNHYLALSDEDLDALRDVIETELTVKKRRDLVIDGYEYRKLCFIEDGFAARYKLLRNGKRQIVNVLLPGDLVGLPGSFLEKAHYSVLAVTDLKIQVCPIDAYVRLCYRRPHFGLALTWLAVHEAVTCAEHIVDAGRRTPEERVAHFLMEVHARLTTVGLASGTTFDLPLSQEIMGDALGLSVPHLNRMLAKLRADGLIAMTDHRVELLDPDALELLGHFQPLHLKRIPDYRC